MPATHVPGTRRRRRRERLARRNARIDAVAFVLVAVVASVVIAYLMRVPPSEPRVIPSAAFPSKSLTDWGDCRVVKAACTAHETPFAAVGVGANKCELRFMCMNAAGQRFVTGVCTTVGDEGC